MVVCAACGAENRLDAAERALRGGYDRLGDYGETGFRSTTGTMLADVLARLGRFDEADELLDEVAGVMTADDVDPQVRLRAVRGQILARRGELAAAERSAREAVALAARTDYLVLNGDALTALADVWLAAGKDEEAAVALREAVEIYKRKEATVKAAKTREWLEALALRL